MSILERFSLEGKVALVTGAAGRHAPAIIQALGEAGATVYGADINFEAMRLVVDRFRKNGLKVSPVQVDQADEVSILLLRDTVLERSNRIDVLVNAAVGRPMKSWQDDPAKFTESMQINGTGLFMMTRTFGDVMERQGRGSIINVSSIHGAVGPDSSLYEGLDRHGFIPDYFFHKAGMINLTRFVASYYGPKNVRCNCIVMGAFRPILQPKSSSNAMARGPFWGEWPIRLTSKAQLCF